MNTTQYIAGDGTMWYLDGKPVRDVRLQEEEKQAAEKAAEKKEAAEKEKEAAVADHQYVLQREAVQSRVLHELQLAKLRDIDGSLQWLTLGVVGVNVLLATMLMRR